MKHDYVKAGDSAFSGLVGDYCSAAVRIKKANEEVLFGLIDNWHKTESFEVVKATLGAVTRCWRAARYVCDRGYGY